MVGTMRTLADYTLGTAIVLMHLVMIALRGEDPKSLTY